MAKLFSTLAKFVENKATGMSNREAFEGTSVGSRRASPVTEPSVSGGFTGGSSQPLLDNMRYSGVVKQLRGIR